LAALVERLLSDPRRIVAIRKDLHLGRRCACTKLDNTTGCCQDASSTCAMRA